MKLTVIRADGTIDEPVEIDPDDEEAVLATLQAAVSGYIQLVPHFNQYEGEPCVAFCDEDGKLIWRHLYNAVATDLWMAQMAAKFPGRKIDDYLNGNVAVVTGSKEDLAKL